MSVPQPGYTPGVPGSPDAPSPAGAPLSGTAPDARDRAAHQWLALVVALAYLLVGVAGFFVTGVDGFTEHDHSQTLLGFAINPLHNVVHLVIAAVGPALWRRPRGARTFGWVLLVGYGAAFVYGLVVAGQADGNVLNLNGADNGLHLVSALVGLAIALWPSRDRSRPGTAPRVD